MTAALVVAAFWCAAVSCVFAVVAGDWVWFGVCVVAAWLSFNAWLAVRWDA